VGDRQGVLNACSNLGDCYLETNRLGKAINLHEQSLETAKEINDREGEGLEYNNLGICHWMLGDYEQTIDFYEQARTIALSLVEKMGNTAKERAGDVCQNLGLSYESLGQYEKAIGLLEQARAIAQQVKSDRSVRFAVRSVGALGRCKTSIGEYAQAITHHTEQWENAQELNIPDDLVGAALGQGVSLWAQARAEHHAAVAAFPLPGTGYPAAYIESLRNAARWLRTASELADTHRLAQQDDALLHLSCVSFDLGEETAALEALQKFLQNEVESACSQCRGCRQRRGEDAPMLTCGGCGVAKFCSEKHQRLASRKGDRLRKAVRHKDVCSLLKKWRRVAQGKATAESCTPDLLEFLRQDILWRHLKISCDDT